MACATEASFSSYLHLWNRSLDTPLNHELYVNVITFEIAENNFIFALVSLINFLLLIYIFYRLASAAGWSGLAYLSPTKLLFKSYTRTLGIYALLAYTVLSLMWSLNYIRLFYYDATDLSWQACHSNVVIANGSRAHIKEIKLAVYGSASAVATNFLNTNQCGCHDGVRTFPSSMDIFHGGALDPSALIIPDEALPSRNQDLRSYFARGHGPLHAQYPTVYDVFDKNRYASFYPSMYNPVTQDNITLLFKTQPSITTNRHVFDRWLPQIYFPNLDFWIEKFHSSMYQLESMGCLTGALFLGLSALRPLVYFLVEREPVALSEIVSRTSAMAFGFYGCVRIILFPLCDLLSTGFSPLIRDPYHLDHFRSYDPIYYDQLEVRRFRNNELRRIQLQDPHTFRAILEEKQRLEREGYTSHFQPYFPLWLTGYIKFCITALERLVVLVFAVITLYKCARYLRKKQRGLAEKQGGSNVGQESVEFGNQHSCLLDSPEAVMFLMRFGALDAQRVPVGEFGSQGSRFSSDLASVLVPSPLSDGSPLHAAGLMRGLMYSLMLFILSLGLHLVVAVVLLVLLMSRHQWILALHPSLFDSLSLMYFFTEWLLFLLILLLLLPSHGYGFFDARKAEDRYRKQENAMRWNYMESILWKLPDLFFKVTVEPLLKPQPPIQMAADVSLDDRRLKYQPPGTYPEPEWMAHKIACGGSLSALTDAQLDDVYGRAIDESSYPIEDTGNKLSGQERHSRSKAHRLHYTPSISPHPANRHKVDGLDHHDEIAKRERKPLYEASASLLTFSPGSATTASMTTDSEQPLVLRQDDSQSSSSYADSSKSRSTTAAFSSSPDSLGSPLLYPLPALPAAAVSPSRGLHSARLPFLSSRSSTLESGRPSSLQSNSSNVTLTSRSESSRGLK